MPFFVRIFVQLKFSGLFYHDVLFTSHYLGLPIKPSKKVMAAQSYTVPAGIRVLHMNILKKVKISESFETPFFDLKRCLIISMTFLHSDNAVFQESMTWVASLKDFSWNLDLQKRATVLHSPFQLVIQTIQYSSKRQYGLFSSFSITTCKLFYKISSSKKLMTRVLAEFLSNSSADWNLHWRFPSKSFVMDK